MANLDAMRRRFALDEEAPVEGGMSPTTTEERLAQFAAVDAEEEANAASRGMSVDDLRFAKRQKQREQEYLDAYGMPMETKPFVQVPPSMRSPETKAENSEPFAAMAPMAERLMASRKQGLPTTSVDFASLQKTMSPGALASPIPFASAPVKADVPEAMKGAIAATTPTQPAPPAGTSSTVKPPPVGAEGTGGDVDELGRLSMGQALVRALEGSGSVISGQNLRSGAAETLGERMKQIEALRAKKLQTAEERAVEASTWGASNRGTLASYIAQYKDRPEIVEALWAMEPAADSTKPGDFNRNIIGALTTRPKVEGVQATTKKTGAQTDVATATAAAVPKKVAVAEGTLVERERANKAREAIQRQALLVKQASDAKVNSAVRAAGSDPRQAEKAISDAMKSAEKKDLGIVSNIRDFQGLESVAPGFTQGRVPSWLGQGSIAAAIKVPGLNKQATQLASALELFTAGIRNSLFGASLTGNEKESFDAIVSSGVLMPPDVLAANINRLRQGAAKFAQNHFTVAQELHPEVTGRVLGASTIFGPAVSEGGIYSDVWKLPKAPAVGAGGANRPPKPMDRSGMKTLWNKKTGQWVRYTPEQEAKARAADAIED